MTWQHDTLTMLPWLKCSLTGNDHEQMFSNEPLDQCCVISVTCLTQANSVVTSLVYSG